MKTRDELHQLLCDILGSNHCYFGPPSNIRMRYPCIVYSNEGSSVRSADDIRYLKWNKYIVTIIDECPESPIMKRMYECDDIKHLSHDRTYVADGMYHYVLTICW